MRRAAGFLTHGAVRGGGCEVNRRMRALMPECEPRGMDVALFAKAWLNGQEPETKR
jgi:hypothetical protein